MIRVMSVGLKFFWLVGRLLVEKGVDVVSRMIGLFVFLVWNILGIVFMVLLIRFVKTMFGCRVVRA